MILFPTADEDYQYFVSEGYNGSINDMHYQALGDIGYTGSYTDRLYSHLTLTYGDYHQALADLRSGVSTFSLLGYAVGGVEPDLVLNFAADYYRTGGVVSTFNDSLTYTGASAKTMVDSDGLLKWAPHNLALNSAAPVTQNITVISGVAYTVECTGTGSITLSGAGTGSASLGVPVEITAATTTLTLTIVGSVDTMWAYRSDLGGMVNNPDRGDSYVPTTSAAVYLPRRGHHIYNGSTWVNEGIQLESEARTNLETESVSLNNLTLGNATQTLGQTDFYGGTDAVLITSTGTSSGFSYGDVFSGAATKTFSAFVKKGNEQYVLLEIGTSSMGTGCYAEIDLDAGTIGAATTLGAGYTAVASTIENWGGGWYRASVTAITPAAAHVGYIGWQGSVRAAEVNDTVYYAAPQFEAGSTPSSYIPTAGATVTRAAETLTVAGSDIANSTSNMSFHHRGKLNFANEGTNPTAVFWHYKSGTDYVSHRLQTNGSNTGLYNARQGDAGQSFDTTDDYFPGVNVAYNNASYHLTSTVRGAKLGVLQNTDATAATLADMSAGNLEFGSNGTDALFIGTISLFRMWDEDLGDTGIAEAST